MRIGVPSWKGRMSPRQRGMWRGLQFLVRLIALSLPLYLVIWLGVNLYPLQVAAASHSAWVLQATGNQAIQQGTGLVVNSSFEFFIIPDCTGWKSMLFLLALIFAVPGVAWKRRLAGLVVGLPLVWMGNLGRIVGVVGSQALWGTEAAMLIHDTAFQLGLVAMVLGLWVIWLRWDSIASALGSLISRKRLRRSVRSLTSGASWHQR